MVRSQYDCKIFEWDEKLLIITPSKQTSVSINDSQCVQPHKKKNLEIEVSFVWY